MNFDFEEALEKYPNVLYKEVICQGFHQGYYIDKEETEKLFNDNYKTYEFLMGYNNKYFKEFFEKNV